MAVQIHRQRFRGLEEINSPTVNVGMQSQVDLRRQIMIRHTVARGLILVSVHPIITHYILYQ